MFYYAGICEDGLGEYCSDIFCREKTLTSLDMFFGMLVRSGSGKSRATKERHLEQRSRWWLRNLLVTLRYVVSSW